MADQSENLLIVADSEHDANMLYATGMFVPDPFIYLRLRGRQFVVMSDLEMDRARRETADCRVLSLSDCQKKLRRQGKKTGFAEVIRCLLGERRISAVVVPDNFPLGLATDLDRLRIRVKARPGNFFPERERKSPAEVRHIRSALGMAEIGMAEGIRALKRSRTAKDGRLIYRDSPLTSERLRSIIDTAILQAGGIANRTIVAGGKQGCDPHESGHGPLRANQPIILDIFPRSQATGYFGDITRTVVRGRPPNAVRRLYDTVLSGQLLAFQMIRAGAATAAIHQGIQELFKAEGYETGRWRGRMQGFFHGTGHGLGLEIHESPRIGTNSAGVLKSGQVVTVEPGLYYPGVGGVRIEDVVSVNERGFRNLTQFAKTLEI